jgi:hypothetical protein
MKINKNSLAKLIKGKKKITQSDKLEIKKELCNKYQRNP